MAAVQFYCPLCGGLFQIDDALAGYEVACPLCSGLVTVPSFEDEPAASPPAATLQVACAQCDQEFQVAEMMRGEDVACPHCAAIVHLPSLEESQQPDDAERRGEVVEAEVLEPEPVAAEPVQAEPVAPQPAPAPLPIERKTAFVIPTERGYVSVHEPLKTVMRGQEAIELKQLSPHQRQRRRAIRNAVLVALCFIALMAVLYAFSPR